ncbi:MAG: LysM domain-containing protein, partial [Myxococcota bacterium]|nr:LysM domain-containing protein [Myxococcota bacterium]
MESGDTLSGLAHLYGCTLEQLRKANKLKNKNVIRYGQTLKIPRCGRGDAPAPESYQVYVVQAGDFPQEIAARFGISWADIRQANPKAPKDARKLRVGMKLRIPPPTHQVHGQNVEYRIQPGDTLDEIADHYGTTVEDIRKKNPRDAADPNNLKAGRTLLVHATKNKRPPKVISYTIQAGDNPSKIAKRYKTTWREIRRLNPRIKDDPRKLRIGQKLKLYHNGPFSSSRGKPHAGRLINGVQLQKGKGYYIRRPYNAWGTEDTIDQLLASIAKVRRKHHKVHD